jgi:hypothetical protein
MALQEQKLEAKDFFREFHYSISLILVTIACGVIQIMFGKPWKAAAVW